MQRYGVVHDDPVIVRIDCTGTVLVDGGGAQLCGEAGKDFTLKSLLTENFQFPLACAER